MNFHEEDTYQIVGVRAAEGESLQLIKPVFTAKDPPDVWLQKMESQLQTAVKFHVLMATATFNKRADFNQWVSNWIGQALLLGL